MLAKSWGGTTYQNKNGDYQRQDNGHTSKHKCLAHWKIRIRNINDDKGINKMHALTKQNRGQSDGRGGTTSFILYFQYYKCEY